MKRAIAVMTCLLLVSLAGSARAGDEASPHARRIANSAEPVVRPGAKVTYADTYCTMNFVFRGSDGRDYLATAGHCPLDQAVESRKTWRRGQGLPAFDASGIRIGEFAMAVFLPNEDIDIALIRLDANVDPNPEMEFFGGPTKMNDEISTGPEVLNMYGHGMGLGDVKRDRNLVTFGGFDDKESIFATGAAIFGDSGSPVTTDANEALGILSAGTVAVRIPESGAPYPGNTIIVRLPHNVAFAEKVMKLRLTLQTAE